MHNVIRYWRVGIWKNRRNSGWYTVGMFVNCERKR